ncbi:hypothetical protein FKM82_016312 [Ascaphus truei]|uniref:high affinity immunoglobulin epsilon receptor subunit gamma isoform X2 n=1 Tax=Ascaphus truei TaxID=8439 RepID=UPI003F59B4FB
MRLLTGAVVLAGVQGAAGLQEPEICYILDCVLFLYGIILTALYCHLKIKTSKTKKETQASLYEQLNCPEKQIYSEIGKEKMEMTKGEGEGVYTGLSAVDKETYETLRKDNKRN